MKVVITKIKNGFLVRVYKAEFEALVGGVFEPTPEFFPTSQAVQEYLAEVLRAD